MFPQFQFVPGARRVSWSASRVLLVFLAGMILICPLAARAQDSPFGAIGRVEGRDISCENGTPASGVTSTVGQSIYVSNGTVVTVHSGQALLTLFAGGQVDICGPAKLTVLLSGDAITLALNFGRVRMELPANTVLRIFTPTIIGTPIDISGGSRDVTVGLSLDDSLCVRATSGAIQLEHQFTGEKLIVPQAGEFFLNAGRLLPVAGTPGSCQCTPATTIPSPPPNAPSPDYAIAVIPRPAPQPAPAPVPQATPVSPTAPSPDHAVVVIPRPAPQPAPDAAPVPVAVEPTPEPEPKRNVEYSMLAEANETHPVVPPAKNAAPAAPPTSTPVYTAVLPPLSFTAGEPTRPPDPTEDMVLLIREARVSPEWEFSGHVAAPEFAQAMQHALGQKPSTAQAQIPADNPAAAAPAKKKGGFWASLKRAFGGGGTAD